MKLSSTYLRIHIVLILCIFFLNQQPLEIWPFLAQKLQILKEALDKEIFDKIGLTIFGISWMYPILSFLKISTDTPSIASRLSLPFTNLDNVHFRSSIFCWSLLTWLTCSIISSLNLDTSNSRVSFSYFKLSFSSSSTRVQWSQYCPVEILNLA